MVAYESGYAVEDVHDGRTHACNKGMLVVFSRQPVYHRERL